MHSGNGTGWSTYRTTGFEYFPNNSTTRYLVALPGRKKVLNGSGTTIASILYFYDSSENTGGYSSMPVDGKLTAVRTRVNVSGSQFTQETYSYDSWGNRTAVTTYSGYGTASASPTTGARTTYTCYGGGGTLGGVTCADDGVHTFPLWTKNAAGQMTQWTYNYNESVPLTESDPNDSPTNDTTITAQYDLFGRMTLLMRPGDDVNSPTNRISYQDYFPFTVTLTQKIDSTKSYIVQRIYDGMGRQTKITSGSTVVDTEYLTATVTRQSVPYQGSSPNLFTVTTLDPSAHTTTVTAPDNTYSITTTDGLTSTVSQYNSDGTIFNNHTTITTKDVWGRVESVTPPTGPSVSYTYDEFDHLHTATRAGVTTTINYDYVGRKTSMSDPDMGAWSYQYDALGSLTRQTDARGKRICMYYDSLSRLVGKHYRTDDNCPSTVPASPDVKYVYDAGTNGKGRRTSMVDQSGTTSWTYDTRGRMASESRNVSGAGVFNTSWAYNAADLPISMIYPDTETVAYTYDSRMLLQSVVGTNPYVSSTTYDAAGRMTDRVLGNGLTQKDIYFPWDQQGGRLDKIVTGSGTWDALNFNFANNIQKLTYSYDTAGNITSILDPLAGPQTQSFTYDALDRLSTASATGGASGLYNETYTYNTSSGNLETKAGVSLQYNDVAHEHAVTNAGTNTYTYDTNGNQTTRVVNGQTYTLGYDAENRLSSVSGAATASFVYDGDGNRVQSTVNSVTTTFVGSYYELTGSQVTKYYYAGNQRVAMRKYTIPQAMTVEYLLGDHLGSTSITTDSSGAKVSEIRYKPWGEIRYSWTSGVATTPSYRLMNYTFTGQFSYMDDPTTTGTTEGFGLMFYNARFYDPATGRFTSADSIIPGGVQGWDRYTYVRNNPIRYNDPTGHIEACDDHELCKTQRQFFKLSAIESWKKIILDKFGIKMSDDTGKNWDLRNLMLVHSSLQNINNFLDGKLREIIGDKNVVFKLAEYKLNPEKCPKLNCEYSGWTGGTTVIFYTKGNAPIRQMNIYHEYGHLIDNLLGHAPRNALQGEGGEGNPSYVGDNGYLNSEALISESIPNDPNYSSVQAIQASDNDPPEQWADIFANAVAGNIDLSKPTGPGVGMYNFITGVLP